MKTLISILAIASFGFAQAPKQHMRPHPQGGMVMSRAIVNQPFSLTIPALKGETGCGLTVVSGPGSKSSQGWKLADGTFSGTPTVFGFYRLKIACTTPQPVMQAVLLNVMLHPPVKVVPVAPPAPIPLN